MYTYYKNTLQNTRLAYLRLITIVYQKLLRPFSRLSRRLFEVKRIKRVYGIAVLSVALSMTFSPNPFSFWKGGVTTSAQAQNIVIGTLITERSVRLPIDRYTVTQKYNIFHQGIDLAAEKNSPIYPIMDGTVILVQRSRTGFGNHLIIDHGSGLQSLYAHMTTISVGKSEMVKRDTVIGTVGSTGHSTGPHLHLQVWQNGDWVNPERFLEDYLDGQIENPGKTEAPKLAKVQYVLPIF